MRFSVIILPVVLLLSSCSAARFSASSADPEPDKPMIVFHDFSIHRTDKEVIIASSGITERPGELKVRKWDPGSLDNPVEVIFLDQNNRRLSSHFIEHPLIRIYEYSSPEGELNKTQQVLDSSTFFLRYSKNKQIRAVLFQTDPSCEIHIQQQIKLQ